MVESTICASENEISQRSGEARPVETNPSEVLEHARQDDNVGAARAVSAHLDEVVVGDVEVERGESLGAGGSGEDGVEAV